MESTCKRLYLKLGFLLMINLVYGSREFANNIIRAVGYSDDYCLDSASRQLIRFREMKRMRNVDDLWDFMESLYDRRDRDPWFQNAYYTLLYDFQKMYVDCLISINLGRGKRHAPSKKLSFLYADQNFYKTP